jgi:diguanylate cyclase (GGDEF)-like protein
MAPAIFVAEQHHAVKQASVVDLATGAYASWYVTQRLDEEIARSLRSGQPVAVVLVGVLDYDDLQRTIGFARRDELLRELATEYAGLTRVFDIVGTRSPSEFIFVLPETGIASAATVIERVQQRTERVATRLGYGDLARSLRVVAGAAATPGDGDRAVAVLLAAEHRLNQNELQYRHSMERS